MPASAKIFQKQDELRFRNYLITEGLVLLVDNRPSGYVQDRLNSFLKPGLHHKNASGPTTP
jgi:chemotaxis protein MotA